MFLSVSTTHRPATDLGFLLHKNPDRVHEIELSFGRAIMFYPETGAERCEFAIMLDVDPVALVRGRSGSAADGMLDQYVNDRPYAASSFMSVALARGVREALAGRSRERQALADAPMPLEALVAPLPVRGQTELVERLFGPLGYRVEMTTHPLDPEREDAAEAVIEKPMRLHERRLDRVAQVIAESGAKRVLDLGCGSGKLIARLLRIRGLEEIVGVEVSSLELARADERFAELPDLMKRKLTLLRGSLIYRDARLRGYDIAALVEVIEHLEPDRLPHLERAVFGDARPGSVIVTTPNRDYNALFENLSAGRFRHPDHRFEWSRAEFSAWAQRVAAEHGYSVLFEGLGDEHADLGAPSQMAVFTR